MRSLEIEAWVLRIVDQLAARQHVEDSLVELKSKWPEPVAAARRIAAHANAARGAPILWVVGLDEDNGVCGADPTELANWFATVRSQFNDAYPDPQDLNVRTGNHTLVALLFDTQRAPFVVKNPAFGSPGGGSVEFEVPWREGRRTRTAKREDLIRLLAPFVLLPEIEFLDLTVSVHERKSADRPAECTWYVRGEVYVIPSDAKAVVFPFHRCKLALRFADGATIDLSSEFRLSEPRNISVAFTRGENLTSYKDSVTVESSSSEAVFLGPGLARVYSSSTDSVSSERMNGAITVVLSLHIAGASTPQSMHIELQPTKPDKNELAKWSLP
jgi:hypothetical protein